MSKILKLHNFFIPCSSFSSQNSIIQWIGQILSNFLGEQIGLDMFQAISTLTKSVRVRKVNRTQTFQFNYKPSYHSIPTRQEYGQNGVCTVPCPLLCSSGQLYSVVCPPPTSHYTSTFIALHVHSLVKGGGACWAYCWLSLKHTSLLPLGTHSCLPVISSLLLTRAALLHESLKTQPKDCFSLKNFSVLHVKCYPLPYMPLGRTLKKKCLCLSFGTLACLCFTCIWCSYTYHCTDYTLHKGRTCGNFASPQCLDKAWHGAVTQEIFDLWWMN